MTRLRRRVRSRVGEPLVLRIHTNDGRRLTLDERLMEARQKLRRARWVHRQLGRMA
jgi:hypothetical protein